ncbi:type I secretion system permease/ATPase [Novosphingobium mangrovi (ex Hu et al. 2023)]|uniref:Type I secretion system permease/ATPase n=1 Tax=Novosphingobium mangrovi (ex Hu et al. 2023) TaxID=2930094 RepID=A0ABT0AF34_9SPHN|nr:type I secretion system permease/ATPase [Novosphingobium mangrovi (ex Hu et al. 2023)]MCJ1961810.1 type I secretion system permease/ATPase [Novosphingobium mangrovi (ex Hu et al. 2023)]
MLNPFGRLSQDLRDALRGLGRVAPVVLVISSVYNVLLLSGSFFMLLVYDDVLPSRSLPSLFSLLALVLLAYVFQAVLDVVRGRIMVHVGSRFLEETSGRVLDILARFELSRGSLPNGTQVVRDADTVRGFLSGPGPLALVDLPWILVYLAVLSVFHWSLGLLALVGVGVLVTLMVANNRSTGPLALETMKAGARRSALAEATLRNAETLKALGMAPSRRDEWTEAEAAYLRANEAFSARASTLSGATKAFRMFLQSATLALGAYLVIEGQATGGIIIASSILSSRALAPVEQVIAHWKSMVACGQALGRMRELMEAVPAQAEPLGLEPPREALRVQGLTAGPPGLKRVTLAEVRFSLKAGDALAVVGRSGSGKTTLARVLCGVWSPLRGAVRLDGATLDQWSASQIAQFMGYVPQKIELFEGTIAENIARFRPDADRDKILAAARAADCHELIVRLEGGYGGRIGPGGGGLSAGQQQRIALARALYGDPFLVVMDEPNSNLDHEGEAALAHAIAALRARGGIAIVIAHRPAIVSQVSHIMVMNGGRVERFETRAEFETRMRASKDASSTAKDSKRAGGNAMDGEAAHALRTVRMEEELDQ